MKTISKGINIIIIFAFILLMLPLSVFANDNTYTDTYSEDFKKISSNGKLSVKIDAPKDDTEEGYLIDMVLPVYLYDTYRFTDKYTYIDYDIWQKNADGTVGVCLYRGTTPTGENNGTKLECHNLEITYAAVNQEKKAEIVALAANIKDRDDNDSYKVKDMEIINFIASGYNIYEDQYYFIHFSNEFNKDIGYGNLTVLGENRAGYDSMFVNGIFGEYSVMQNGELYTTLPFVGAEATNIIFVPDGTSDADLMSTAQARINEYLKGSKMEGKLELTKSNKLNSHSIADFLSKKIGNIAVAEILDHAQRCDYSTIPATCVFYTEEDWENEALYGEFDVADEDKYDYDGFIYYIENKVTNEKFPIIIARDSSQMITDMQFKASDLDTKVSIETTSSSVPKDTNLTVENKGTSLNQSLKLTEGVSYDITLTSKSGNKTISEANGESFTVNVPVSGNLAKQKNLTAYYINEDGTVEEIDAPVTNGVATFKTTHFSTYTIGYKKTTNNENVPFTIDNIHIYIILTIISLISIISCTLYLRKNYK